VLLLIALLTRLSRYWSMAGKEDSDSTAHQQVSPSGDAYVAGRDVNLHLSPGVALNYYGQLRGVNIRSVGLAGDINPLDLLVQPASGIDKSAGSGASLTPYLERDHDRLLRDAVQRAAERGPSVFAFLEGDSAVGKTRALYEAIRAITPDWPVIWPTDGEELLHWLESGQVNSGMVLWLNESQTYFDPEVGPRAAARLDSLLRSTSGIVAVGTLWRHPFLEKYLNQDEQPDKYAPVRHLLNLGFSLGLAADRRACMGKCS